MNTAAPTAATEMMAAMITYSNVDWPRWSRRGSCAVSHVHRVRMVAVSIIVVLLVVACLRLCDAVSLSCRATVMLCDCHGVLLCASPPVVWSFSGGGRGG